MRAIILSLVFFASSFAVSNIVVGQEPKPTTKQDAKDKETPKTEPKTKLKGFLPTYYGQLGLTDEQKQKVYGVRNKAEEEINKLEAQIKALREKSTKDCHEILTTEQKKKLEDILKMKAGG